LSTAAHLFAF
jgi:hypothetical protein